MELGELYNDSLLGLTDALLEKRDWPRLRSPWEGVIVKRRKLFNEVRKKNGNPLERRLQQWCGYPRRGCWSHLSVSDRSLPSSVPQSTREPTPR